jgi:hypothetical protein
MTKLQFIGKARAVAQVDTITIGGTWADGDTVRVTIGVKTLEYMCGTGETTSTVAAGLHALLAVSNDVEFDEVDWTVASAVITATAGVAGVPSFIAVAKTAASGTITLDSVTAATGPNHWDNALNWSTGSVPVNSDEVSVENGSILYGFPSSLTLASFDQVGGAVGLPDSDYRTGKYLTIGATRVTVSGSISRSRINTGTTASVTTVATSSGVTDLLINSATADVYVSQGSVVIGRYLTDVCQGRACRAAQNAALTIGPSTTVATVLSAGITQIKGTCTTATVEAGRLTLTGTVDDAVINGGTLEHRSLETMDSLTINGGLLDLSSEVQPKTITDVTIRTGEIRDMNRVLTITNNLQIESDRIAAY